MSTPAPPTPNGPTDWLVRATEPGSAPSDRLYVRSQLFQARIKANDVVQEHLKQIVTVASAALALTVTFLKDVLGNIGELHWGWMLPAAWVGLGASILLAVLSLAALVNNLDSAGDDPQRAFQAGGRRRTQVPVLLTFLVFGAGMLLLGVFAARNYKGMLQFQKEAYAVSSAAEAVKRATTSLEPNEIVRAVRKAELITGIAGSAQQPVWHVELALVEPAAPLPVAAPVQRARKKGRREEAPQPPATAAIPKPSTQVDVFVDAGTGDLTRVPAPKPAR